MFRKDLMEEAGMEMPNEPTWEFIREAAAAMTDRENDDQRHLRFAARPAGARTWPS